MKSILLLHGALGTKGQFSKLISELEKSRNVYSFNFEGHGGRPSNRSFNMHHFSENINEFCEANKLVEIDVFGYSMGGYVALTHAIQHPNRLGKIITLGTKFDWTPSTASHEVKQLDPNLIELKVPKFAEKLRKEHAPLDWKSIVNKTAEMIIDLGSGSGILEEKFSELPQKVLICRGSDDVMVSRVESQRAANLISNASYLELENISHSIEKADSTILTSAIISF